METSNKMLLQMFAAFPQCWQTLKKKALNSIYGGGNSHYPRFVFYTHNKQPVGTTRMFYFVFFAVVPLFVSFPVGWRPSSWLLSEPPGFFFFFFQHGFSSRVKKRWEKNPPAQSVACAFVGIAGSDRMKSSSSLQCSSLQQPPHPTC